VLESSLVRLDARAALAPCVGAEKIVPEALRLLTEPRVKARVSRSHTPHFWANSRRGQQLEYMPIPGAVQELLTNTVL
jgi:hypothetical protein